MNEVYFIFIKIFFPFIKNTSPPRFIGGLNMFALISKLQSRKMSDLIKMLELYECCNAIQRLNKNEKFIYLPFDMLHSIVTDYHQIKLSTILFGFGLQ